MGAVLGRLVPVGVLVGIIVTVVIYLVFGSGKNSNFIVGGVWGLLLSMIAIGLAVYSEAKAMAVVSAIGFIVSLGFLIAGAMRV